MLSGKPTMIYKLARILADVYLEKERPQEKEQRLFWFTCKHSSEWTTSQDHVTDYGVNVLCGSDRNFFSARRTRTPITHKTSTFIVRYQENQQQSKSCSNPSGCLHAGRNDPKRRNSVYFYLLANIPERPPLKTTSLIMAS